MGEVDRDGDIADCIPQTANRRDRVAGGIARGKWCPEEEKADLFGKPFIFKALGGLLKCTVHQRCASGQRVFWGVATTYSPASGGETSAAMKAAESSYGDSYLVLRWFNTNPAKTSAVSDATAGCTRSPTANEKAPRTTQSAKIVGLGQVGAGAEGFLLSQALSSGFAGVSVSPSFLIMF